MSYVHLPEPALRRFCQEIFCGYGFTGLESETITDVLLTADLYGIESHGVQRLIRYHEGILDGSILTKTAYEITHETKLSAVIDAHKGMGQVVSKAAMELAIAKAKEHGFGTVVVNRSNHYGIAGYYASMAAAEDLVGMCFTNTEAIAVPTFARNAMLGTNPISFSMPADPVPFWFDIATTVVPRGKLEVYVKRETPMPLGWGVDAAGVDSTDAGEVVGNIIGKSGGGILPLGGSSEESGSHKGYGLGMLVEIATSIFAGGVTSNHIGHSGNGETAESFFALDYGMFGDKAEMKRNLSTLLQELRDCVKADGQERVYTHGEKELESKAEKLKNGIPVNEKTLAELKMIGDCLSVSFSKHLGSICSD